MFWCGSRSRKLRDHIPTVHRKQEALNHQSLSLGFISSTKSSNNATGWGLSFKIRVPWGHSHSSHNRGLNDLNMNQRQNRIQQYRMSIECVQKRNQQKLCICYVFLEKPQFIIFLIWPRTFNKYSTYSFSLFLVTVLTSVPLTIFIFMEEGAEDTID